MFFISTFGEVISSTGFVNSTNNDFNFNIIINLDNLNNISFLTKIYNLLDLLKKNKKSLVVVSSDLIDKQVNVVPTLSEAYDIIELEEIESDLLS